MTIVIPTIFRLVWNYIPHGRSGILWRDNRISRLSYQLGRARANDSSPVNSFFVLSMLFLGGDRMELAPASSGCGACAGVHMRGRVSPFCSRSRQQLSQEEG